MTRALWIALLLVSACSKPASQEQAPPGLPAPTDTVDVTILASSELKDLAPALEAAAKGAGVRVKFSYAGTLEIVERIQGGEGFDMILPANGAYPALALEKKPLAREKLFYSRVALGVKESKARELGWDRRAPSWSEITAAVKSGQLRYAMTSPSSSNTGMSALFAVASSVAKKTEDLTVADVRSEANTQAIKDFLAGQRLTAGSSGWLADAYLRQQDQLDAMVNYEAVILRLNPTLRDALRLIYPADGVISADYPLLLLREDARAAHRKLVEVWRSPAFQGGAPRKAFLRPANPDVAPAPELPQGALAELSFPNNLSVIDEVLLAYHADWRRPATSIFVLDTSGSMVGARIEGLRAALRVLSGADTTSLTARYARFQTRERVVLIPFATQPSLPQRYAFAAERATNGAVESSIRDSADQLLANGGTAIYSALIAAYQVARSERASEPERTVTIALLTDGENRNGASAEQFARTVEQGEKFSVFPILFGEASQGAMDAIAQLTGGRVFDGNKSSLASVFKEIRGYQ
jgi:Ca-activated chloride channel family protein